MDIQVIKSYIPPPPYCQSCKRCTNCGCFEKILELEKLGVKVYRYAPNDDQDKNTWKLYTPQNTIKSAPNVNVYVIINNNEVHVATDDIIREVDTIKVSCPRCQYKMKNVHKMLHSGLILKNQDVMGICDHCREKQLARGNCTICTEIVKKFLDVKKVCFEERLEQQKPHRPSKSAPKTSFRIFSQPEPLRPKSATAVDQAKVIYDFPDETSITSFVSLFGLKSYKQLRPKGFEYIFPQDASKKEGIEKRVSSSELIADVQDKIQSKTEDDVRHKKEALNRQLAEGKESDEVKRGVKGIVERKLSVKGREKDAEEKSVDQVDENQVEGIGKSKGIKTGAVQEKGVKRAKIEQKVSSGKEKGAKTELGERNTRSKEKQVGREKERETAQRMVEKKVKGKEIQTVEEKNKHQGKEKGIEQGMGERKVRREEKQVGKGKEKDVEQGTREIKTKVDEKQAGKGQEKSKGKEKGEGQGPREIKTKVDEKQAGKEQEKSEGKEKGVEQETKEIKIKVDEKQAGKEQEKSEGKEKSGEQGLREIKTKVDENHAGKGQEKSEGKEKGGEQGPREIKTKDEETQAGKGQEKSEGKEKGVEQETKEIETKDEKTQAGKGKVKSEGKEKGGGQGSREIKTKVDEKESGKGQEKSEGKEKSGEQGPREITTKVDEKQAGKRKKKGEGKEKSAEEEVGEKNQVVKGKGKRAEKEKTEQETEETNAKDEEQRKKEEQNEKEMKAMVEKKKKEKAAEREAKKQELEKQLAMERERKEAKKKREGKPIAENEDIKQPEKKREIDPSFLAKSLLSDRKRDEEFLVKPTRDDTPMVFSSQPKGVFDVGMSIIEDHRKKKLSPVESFTVFSVGAKEKPFFDAKLAGVKKVKVLKDFNLKCTIRGPSYDNLILKLVRTKQEEKKLKSKSLKGHVLAHLRPSLGSMMSIDSDLELELESLLGERRRVRTGGKVKGAKIVRNKPEKPQKEQQWERVPKLHHTKYEQDQPLQVQDIEEDEPLPLLETTFKGVLSYSLSDRTFIKNGWTVLPTEKVVRKMNVYRMRPSHPEFDWFAHNKHKGVMQYDTGEKLAQFDDNGRGRWYYRNGRVALDYYDSEEIHSQQRIVVYSSGEPDERGRSRPITVLAMFDYLGNGVVFDHSGKIRVKYNQTQGVVLDREIGPVSTWKWHSLNDPPVLQKVMIDTHMTYPEIFKLRSPDDKAARPNDEEMLAIEYDIFLKERKKKLSQKFQPFQIKMKALKINEQFSLRIIDQATVHLIFRDGSTNLKLNLGMILDHQEIVDTEIADVGDVINSIERFPARTDSLLKMQCTIAEARSLDHARTKHARRVCPPTAVPTVDCLVAALSRPLRPPPLRSVPSSSLTSATGAGAASSGRPYSHCMHRKPAPPTLYYNTRFI